MGAFAGVSDLEARWRPLTPAEKGRAGALLDDAAAIIGAEFSRCGKPVDDADPALLAMTSCAMVRRAMASGTGADVTQQSMTAGVFSQSLTLANPTGDLYLTRDERLRLGVPRRAQRIGSVGPWGGGGDVR